MSSQQSNVNGANGEQIRYTYIFLGKQRDFIEPFLKVLKKKGLNFETVGILFEIA